MAAIALAALSFWLERDAGSTPVFLLLVAGYAVLYRVEFAAGPGAAVPTQLVFVPMLVLLPPLLVPASVGLAILATAAWDWPAAQGPRRQRPFLVLSGAWASIPPALLVAAVAPATFGLGLLIACCLVQVATDAIVHVVRVHLLLGYPARPLMRVLAWSYVIDFSLAPIGLLIAMADRRDPALSMVAVSGLTVFLVVLARERDQQSRRATALIDAYRDAAEKARRDPLTGLVNRLGWAECVSALAPATAVAVVLLDVNGLKRANDTRGHEFGDRLLREVAEVTARAGSAAQIVARLGGDEFAILVNGDEAARVATIAAGLRRALDAHPGLDGFPLGAAVGYGGCPPADSFAAAFAAADAAIYTEKGSDPRSRQVA